MSLDNMQKQMKSDEQTRVVSFKRKICWEEQKIKLEQNFLLIWRITMIDNDGVKVV